MTKTEHDPERWEMVRDILRRQISAYIEPRSLRGMRLLDFGCGKGGSTFALADLLPDTRIVGLELLAENVRYAQRIAAQRQLTEVEFLASPSGARLPEDIGEFDVVMLSAVYEHLLPEERRMLLPQLWARLRVGGVLFVNQTPHRWFPYEHHSTGLWGINYMPDRLAHGYARRFAKLDSPINRSPDWETHLRGGLRGGTERGIIADLTFGSSTRGVILQPRIYRDRAAYWLSGTSLRFRVLKRCIALSFRICGRLFDSIPALNIDVAIRKEAN